MSRNSSRTMVLFDSTFRDGVQEEGVKAENLSDALRGIQAIDEMGIAYHELGFAVSNKAAQHRIKEALKLPLNGKVAAFGRTKDADTDAILALGVRAGVVVGKSRKRDALVALNATPEKNLGLIHNAIIKLKHEGLEVIYDAEHAFQAFYNDDPNYFIETLQTALLAGARWIVLCDTNGKMTPQLVYKTIRAVSHYIPVERLGIHCHNDRGRAVINSEAAWTLGVRHIQGTFGGWGERTGNADLVTLIPNLYFDYKAQGITSRQLEKLKPCYLLICDALNQTPDPKHPWVGDKAFYTEAGMHEDAQLKDRGNYWHANPTSVGNSARTGVTEQSGRANILSKARELGIKIPKDELPRVALQHMTLVDSGADFGLADASFKLFVLRALGHLPCYFRFLELKLETHKPRDADHWQTSAEICFEKDETENHDAVKITSEGVGPVHALDRALQPIVHELYPTLQKVRLIDYRVKIISTEIGSAAKVRVIIQFSDGQKVWTTMAADENIIEASWRALLEGYVYDLVETHKTPHADATKVNVSM